MGILPIPSINICLVGAVETTAPPDGVRGFILLLGLSSIRSRG